MRKLKEIFIYSPSSISGGKPPTNTFLEYFSSFSCSKACGEDCAPGGRDAMNTCPSTIWELGFSIMAAAACSSSPGKNGLLSATLKNVDKITKLILTV